MLAPAPFCLFKSISHWYIEATRSWRAYPVNFGLPGVDRLPVHTEHLEKEKKKRNKNSERERNRKNVWEKKKTNLKRKKTYWMHVSWAARVTGSGARTCSLLVSVVVQRKSWRERDTFSTTLVYVRQFLLFGPVTCIQVMLDFQLHECQIIFFAILTLFSFSACHFNSLYWYVEVFLDNYIVLESLWSVNE